MNRIRLSIIVGLSLISFARPASAQAPSAKAKARPAGKDNSDAKSEAERIAKERRAQGHALLLSLANDARNFRDQTVRVRSLMRIADVLWSVDAEQGRTLFRQAWAGAEAADEESQERRESVEGDVAIDPTAVTEAVVAAGKSIPDLRREVLRVVARRDAQLAEEFLQSLKAEQHEDKPGAASPNLWELSEAQRRRLSLAEELLRTGDIERALQFADPVLGSATMPTLDFLTLLHEKNPAAADQRYSAMLMNTRGDLTADANTVSVLSSYLFTPQVYVTFDRYGAPSYSMMPSPPAPPNVAPQLRLAFFQTAAAVLLRPQPPAEQDQSTAGVLGKYMVVRRLMPLFERYAQRDVAEAVRGQLEALNVQVSDSVRQSDDEWEKKGLSPEKPLGDQEQTLLDQIERATTSGERNELYFKLALLTLNKGDVRARDYASKIDESGFRKQARAWVDASLAITAVEKKKVDTALELARTGELTNLQRVWVLTQAAKLLSATDRIRALSLLEEAIAESRRIQGYDADRPRRLLAIANAVRLVEPSRVWNALSDAVEAANSTDGFTGEGGALTLVVSSKSLISSRTYNVPDFDVAGIFREVANDSYDNAAQLALGIKGEAARANAAIAVARAVLDEKSAPVRAAPRPVK
jgi:hypothetical protein